MIHNNPKPNPNGGLPGVGPKVATVQTPQPQQVTPQPIQQAQVPTQQVPTQVPPVVSKPEEGKPLEVSVNPLSIDEIQRLMSQPLPDSGAMQDIATGANEAQAARLKELQDTKEKGEIDYSQVQFVNDDTFAQITESPDKMNLFMQNLANYIGKDVAEKIAFSQRKSQDYAEQQDRKMINDIQTSQLIHNFLGNDDNSDLKPYQNYFMFRLIEERKVNNGISDLHLLLRNTAQKVRDEFKQANIGNQNTATPAFGGLGGFNAPNGNNKGDWSNLFKEFTGQLK